VLADVARGEDPVERRAADRAAITVAALCDEYLEKAERGLIITRRRRPKKRSTLTIDRGRIERHIKPLLGHRAVKDLTAPDLRAFLRDVIAGKTKANVKTKGERRAIVTGGPGTATRTMGLLGGILSYAVEEGYRTDNPAHGIVKPAYEKRSIRLDVDGYKRLGDLLQAPEERGECWQAVEAVRLIALTGCRRGEVVALRRPEADVPGQALPRGHENRRQRSGEPRCTSSRARWHARTRPMCSPVCASPKRPIGAWLKPGTGSWATPCPT